MEKQQLVNFVAKVMEDAGFKVYKDFKTSQKIIDIYGVLPTVMGDFGVVVACKNYDKQWEVGIDILKEMEMVGRNLKASKVAVISSSNFSPQARNYASRKNIKLVDRDNLMILAKKFSKKKNDVNNDNPCDEEYPNTGFIPSSNSEFDNTVSSDSGDGYNSDDYDSNYVSYDSEGVYADDSTYISGKSSSGLGKYGSRSSAESSQRTNPIRSNLANQKPKIQGPPLSERIKPILNNTIVLIILVVGISYLISVLVGAVSGASKGVTGLVKILSSLILSYGIVLSLNREGTTVLVKGSTVFFVSLVILIIIIILL